MTIEEGPLTEEEAKEQVAAEEPNDDTEPPAEPVEDKLEGDEDAALSAR